MVIFNSYVSFPEGNIRLKIGKQSDKVPHVSLIHVHTVPLKHRSPQPNQPTDPNNSSQNLGGLIAVGCSWSMNPPIYIHVIPCIKNIIPFILEEYVNVWIDDCRWLSQISHIRLCSFMLSIDFPIFKPWISIVTLFTVNILPIKRSYVPIDSMDFR